MGAGLDGAALEVGGGDVPKEQGFAVAHLHSEHLVEVAVVDLTHPADAQGGAAHEVLNGGGVIAVGQEFEVGIPLAVLAEVFGEAADGLVGNPFAHPQAFGFGGAGGRPGLNCVGSGHGEAGNSATGSPVRRWTRFIGVVRSPSSV